jgi:hypothetical protein
LKAPHTYSFIDIRVDGRTAVTVFEGGGASSGKWSGQVTYGLGYNTTPTIPGNNRENRCITRDSRPGVYVCCFNIILRIIRAGHSLFALNVLE